MRFRPHRALLWTLAAALTASVALGQTPDVRREPATLPAPSARVEVAFGVVGTIAPEQKSTLGALLRSELEAMGLTLIEHDPEGELRSWARAAASDDRRLLAVLLDARASTGWRLVVIDAARGRAISRDLPGGESNRASIEACVSIVLSATSALKEGLEVASAPVEAVVGPAASSAPPTAPSPKSPRQEPPPAAPAARGVTLHGGVAASLASLSNEPARTTLGVTLTLGLSPHRLVAIDAAVSRHFPSRFESAFGGFAVDRTFSTLSVGPPFHVESFVLTPQLGLAGEWLARSRTDPAPGVTAEAARSFQRFGGMLALRARYIIIRPVSAELVLGAAFFDRSIEFLGGNSTLSKVDAAVAILGLGLDVASE